MKKIIILIFVLLLSMQTANAAVTVIDKLAPQNDAFQGLIDNDQIIDIAATAGNCLTSDGSFFVSGSSCAGGGTGLATSTTVVDNYIAVGTGPDDVGFYSNFTFDNTTNIFTVPNASTTNLSVSGYFDFLGTVITSVATWYSGLFDSNLATKDTDDLTQGATNLYNQTHSGEVTGATSLTIADNIIEEANLELTNSPTDDYILSFDTTSGGFTWVIDRNIGAPADVLLVDVNGFGEYTTITSAIAAAISGDLIYVSPGTYSEGTLAIPTGVEVVCSSPDTTIIESTSATGVTVTDNSALRNCTAQTLATDATTIKSATGEAEGVEITGNTIISSRYGFFSDNTDYIASSTISNNRFELTATSSNLAAALTIHNNSVAPTVIQNNEVYVNRTAGTGDSTGIQFPGSNLGEDKTTHVIGNSIYVVSNGSGETNGWEVSGGGQRYFVGNTFDVVNTGTGTTTGANDWGTNVGEHNVFSNGNVYRVRSGSGNGVALWEHNQSSEDTKSFSGDTFISSSASGASWDIYYDPQILAGQAQIVNSSYDPTKVFQKSTQNFVRSKVGITSLSNLTTTQITDLGKNAADLYFDSTVDALKFHDGNYLAEIFSSSSTPVAGDVGYYNNAGWQLLNKGSDGEVLKLASGIPSWGTDNDSGGSGNSFDYPFPSDATTTAITFNGTTDSAYFAERIAHAGEATNYIGFTSANQSFSIGGTTFLNWNTSGFTPLINFNPNGSNVDYQFETSGNTSALYILNSNGFVGVGDPTPGTALDVNGSATANALLARSNDSGALGASGTAFSDLFLASGGVINWLAGDVTLTHSSGALTLSADLFDLGGSILEIPNGTAPVVDSIGETALDSTDNQLLIGDSAGTARVFARAEQPLFSLSVGSTSIEMVSGGILPIAKNMKDGRDITQFRCYVTSGTSVVVNVSDGTNDTETISCLTTMTSDTDVATNSTFTADEKWELQIGTITGTVDELVFEAYGYITRE